MSIIDTLITDRTQGDLIELERLQRKAKAGTLTEEELAQWNLASHRGGYNHTDLNRVADAVEYLTQRLNEWGYHVPVIPRTQWTETGYYANSEFSAWLASVAAVRSVLTMPATTPYPTANIRYMTIQMANDIEKILVDVEDVINTMISTLPLCGEAICGGDYL